MAMGPEEKPVVIPAPVVPPDWMILVDRDEQGEVTRVPMPAKRPRMVWYEGGLYHQVRARGRDMVYRAN